MEECLLGPVGILGTIQLGLGSRLQGMSVEDIREDQQVREKIKSLVIRLSRVEIVGHARSDAIRPVHSVTTASGGITIANTMLCQRDEGRTSDLGQGRGAARSVLRLTMLAKTRVSAPSSLLTTQYHHLSLQFENRRNDVPVLNRIIRIPIPRPTRRPQRREEAVLIWAWAWERRNNIILLVAESCLDWEVMLPLWEDYRHRTRLLRTASWRVVLVVLLIRMWGFKLRWAVGVVLGLVAAAVVLLAVLVVEVFRMGFFLFRME